MFLTKTESSQFPRTVKKNGICVEKCLRICKGLKTEHWHSIEEFRLSELF
jgi:hypothetical protein